MVLRWIGAALTDASGRFRAVRRYRDMPMSQIRKLAAILSADVDCLLEAHGR